ncbi:unnamed protein product, partial [Adineta ricciae]
MASNDERVPKFVHVGDESQLQGNEPILFGFEQELKSITVRHGDSARFEAKIRLISMLSSVQIDRSLLTVEWRLNDEPLAHDEYSRYHRGSIPGENLYWMDVRQCEQEDEGVYTICISYDHGKFRDESSAYLFVDSFITEKEEQPDQLSQQGLTADDAWFSATSLDRFIPPTITRPLLSTYRCQPRTKLQLQVEFFSPSVQCHCTWHVQYLNDPTPGPILNGSIINTNYSSTLTIHSITTDLQGTYSFHVENIYGNAKTQTHVIVDKDSSDDELEYQEVPEEPPLKKLHVDDDSHLEVHIPGGETENIILSTEFTPQQPNVFGQLPIIQELSSERRLQLQPGDKIEIEDTNVTVTLNQQQQQQQSRYDHTKFQLPTTSTITETVEEIISEAIPQSLTDVTQWSPFFSDDHIPPTTSLTPSLASRTSGSEQYQRLAFDSAETSASASTIHSNQQQQSGAVRQMVSSISQPRITTDLPLFDETAIHLDRLHRPSATETVQYIAPIDILPTVGTILRTTSALSQEELPHEVGITLQQIQQQHARASKQQTKSITQPSFAIQTPIFDEAAINLAQAQLPHGQQTTQSAPTTITTTPTSTPQQFISNQPPATTQQLSITELQEQKAKHIMHPTISTDHPILSQPSLHPSQMQRSERPQTIHNKTTTTEVQSTSANILTQSSTTSQDEIFHETP